MADQHPLFDTEIEQCLIGAFLVDNTTIAQVRALVRPDDFHHQLHQFIAELCFQFDEEGKAISPITLNGWIKHHPVCEEADKLAGEALPPGRRAAIYLAMLAEGCPAKPGSQVSYWADMVADFSLRRKAMWAMGEAMDLISAREKAMPGPILQALEPVVAIADDITDALLVKDVDTSAVQRGNTLLRAIDQQAVAPEQFGVQTGLDPLDELIGGLYPENLYIIGGRPGMGKSILACHLLLSAARQDYAADYWSIEMPSREVLARLWAAIDYEMAVRERLKPLIYENFVKMRASSGERERAAQANLLLEGLEINILDRDRVTMDTIAQSTRARVARNPKKKRLTVIDHLHIVQPSQRYAGRRVDELSEITFAGKRLAKRIGGPVVMLAQLGRDLERREDKRPQMADFRDSGSIEQDADVVMSVYRGAYYAAQAYRAGKTTDQRTNAEAEAERTKNLLEIEVHKQRSGATRVVEVFIDPKSSVVCSFDPWKVPPPQGDLVGLAAG